jgi:hypothetical protein
MISWYVDKFHDFLILCFIFKQLDLKFAVMFRKHGVQKFQFVPEIGCNLC